MNMPMSVHADALQVVLPKATADNTAIWISAGATVVGTLLGVILGYLISEQQRRKIEHQKELGDIYSDILYVQGTIAAQANRMNKWIGVVVENQELLLKNPAGVRFTAVSVLDVAYQRLARIQKIYPEVMAALFNMVDNIENLNDTIAMLHAEVKEEKKKYEKKGIALSKVDCGELYSEYFKIFTLALTISSQAEESSEKLFFKSKLYFRRDFKRRSLYRFFRKKSLYFGLLSGLGQKRYKVNFLIFMKKYKILRSFSTSKFIKKKSQFIDLIEKLGSLDVKKYSKID